MCHLLLLSGTSPSCCSTLKIVVCFPLLNYLAVLKAWRMVMPLRSICFPAGGQTLGPSLLVGAAYSVAGDGLDHPSAIHYFQRLC